MNLDGEAVRMILLQMITLILSIAVHEFGHAIVAYKLGDNLPKQQGRVTLNPMAHADPMGTLLFPMVFLVMSGGRSIGFGWGKPVQVRPVAFTRRFHMRTGHMLVALAGPMMNVVLGLVVIIIHAMLLRFQVIGIDSDLNLFLYNAAALNFILFFFNLIPAPPLDGGAVVEGLLPARLVPGFQRYAVYGPFVLMAVIFIPGAGRIFATPALWVVNHAYGLML
jgi:Zn-dependent protease